MPKRLLLDTHIWLWTVGDRRRLSHRVARTLAASANELWISPISSWEILMLSQKKRLNLRPDATSWIQAALNAVPCNEAPLTHEVAIATESVTLPRNDPSGKLLAATARAFNLTLITADENILRGSGFAVMAND